MVPVLFFVGLWNILIVTVIFQVGIISIVRLYSNITVKQTNASCCQWAALASISCDIHKSSCFMPVIKDQTLCDYTRSDCPILL